MAVHPNAQHLHGNGAITADEGILLFQLAIDGSNPASVKQKLIGKRAVHGSQQLGVHKVGAAPLILRPDTYPVIQLYKLHPCWINHSAVDAAHELPQHPNRCISARKANQALRVFLYGLLHQVSRTPAHCLIILFNNYSHDFSSSATVTAIIAQIVRHC